MITFALKTTLEVAAVVLLIIGYINEEKVIAFEQKLWKRLRGEPSGRPVRTAPAHSATYNAAREAEQRALRERERIARNAEYARRRAALAAPHDEPRRVA